MTKCLSSTAVVSCVPCQVTLWQRSLTPLCRFIASPFGYGVRLLGFSESGAELSDCQPSQPSRLVELGTKLGHNEVRQNVSSVEYDVDLPAAGCPVFRLLARPLVTGHWLPVRPDSLAPARPVVLSLTHLYLCLKFILTTSRCV